MQRIGAFKFLLPFSAALLKNENAARNVNYYYEFTHTSISICVQ